MPLFGAPMTRDHFIDLLEPNVRKVFFNQWDVVGNDYEDIYNIQASDKRQEHFVTMGGVGLWQRKSEGVSPFFDSGQEAYKVSMTNECWSLGFEITKEAIQDNLYQGAMDMAKDLGTSGAYTKNVQAFSPFNNLSDTVYTANGTNYTLLSTTHFRIDSGTFRNRPTTAVDLGLEAIETAIAEWIVQMVDQRGRKLSPLPVTLMVGPSDWSIAQRICMSDKRPFSNNNDPNVVKSQYNLRPKIARHLTDDGRWFLFAPKEQTGLYYNDRQKTMITRDTDPRTKNVFWIGDYRECHGVVNPTGIWGSP